MKKQILFVLFCMIAFGSMFAQVPQAFKYQGVARDAAGLPLNTQAITVRLSIRDISSTGAVIYQETHQVTTNSFGLFNVSMGQGTVISGNFPGINWGLNNKYIEQEVDFGTGFVNMGTSQFLSVPYALYSGNGGASTSYTSGSGIAFTGSVISNTAPDQTITISSGLNTAVSGAYPNFTVDATPSLSITGDQLSISNGNTVTLPASSFTPGNGISIVSGSVITNTAPDVPVTFTNSGPATITGTYPNYTLNSVNSPTYTNGNGISITSGSIINTAPDITPTVAITTTAAAGAAVSSSGSSFNINVPPPTFTNSGPATITGTYPNYTLNSVNSPTYTNGAGISITSGSIINTAPNITPTVAITTTAAATASVSSSGNTFNINVPPPSFTNAGPATITGTYPNYTLNSVNSPTYTNGAGISITSGSIINTAPNITPTIAVTTTAAAGASVTSTGNTFNINVPAPTFTNSGPTTITGSYPNFTVNSSSGNAWQLSGNAGTAPATNYLGTSDAQALVFRTNALERIRIDANGLVGIGTNNPTSRLNIFSAATDISSGTGLSVTNNYTSTANKYGIDVNVDGAGSGAKFGINSTVVGLAGDGNGNYAYQANMTPNGSGSAFGYNTTINAAGSGIRYGHYTSVSSIPANNSNIYGHRILMSGTNATAIKYGMYVSGEDANYFSRSVGIGTTTPAYKLVLAGPQANGIDGPNMSFVTSQDNYPTMHLFNWNHSEQYMMFNAYYDGAFRSSATNGNFKMGSYNGKLIFQAAGGYAPGTNMNTNFLDAMMIGNNGFVGIGIDQANLPGYQFHVNKNVAGVLSFFENTSQSAGTGVRTEVTTVATSGGTRYGLYSHAANGQGVNYGTYTHGRGGQQSFGLWTESGGQSAVWNMGIYSSATGTNGVYAAYMIGNVWVGGTLSKSAGTFKIDHPQDPENKFLIHSFVESPDMMNVYNGNALTDGNGDVTVQLPTYFEAENIDFKYQLTVIGQFAQAVVMEEIANNQFKIKTDKPNVKVSWQVTGVRNDKYAQKNRVVPEVDKKGEEIGNYLAPEVYGLDESRRIGPKREQNDNTRK